jgi:uncharacterized membrane protein HdeD (DUF308 family)
MQSERSEGVGQGESSSLAALVSWQASLILGLFTLILGVIIAFRPTQSLTAIAALLGVVMLVGGIYHIVRALGGHEHERVWRGIAGVLFVLTGLVLLRHLHLSVALIGLFIGFTWIIQGVTSLMEGFSRARSSGERGWSVIFGIVSLAAGIIVVFAPIGSLATLTVFLGIWFIVMGILEIVGSLAVRRALRKRAAEGVSVPAQREQRPDQATTKHQARR